MWLSELGTTSQQLIAASCTTTHVTHHLQSLTLSTAARAPGKQQLPCSNIHLQPVADANALLFNCLQVVTSAAVSTTPATAFMPAQLAEITEPAAQQMASRMQRTPVPIPSLPIPPIETAFVGPSKQQQAQLKALSNAPPVVLLHGFDSSCLEFRRLYPLLESRSETWAVDLVSLLQQQVSWQIGLGVCTCQLVCLYALKGCYTLAEVCGCHSVHSATRPPCPSSRTSTSSDQTKYPVRLPLLSLLALLLSLGCGLTDATAFTQHPSLPSSSTSTSYDLTMYPHVCRHRCHCCHCCCRSAGASRMPLHSLSSPT